MASVAERLKALERVATGTPWEMAQGELAAIRAEVEAVAREMRYGDYKWDMNAADWAARLAPEEKPLEEAMTPRIEDVIAEVEWRADDNECMRGYADRLTAALERERAAILKVAEEMDKASRANEKFGWTPSAEQARMGDWAAELRRIAEGHVGTGGGDSNE